MKIGHSSFRIILGTAALGLLYVGYGLVSSEKMVQECAGVALIALTIWGTLWADHQVPPNN